MSRLVWEVRALLGSLLVCAILRIWPDKSPEFLSSVNAMLDIIAKAER